MLLRPRYDDIKIIIYYLGKLIIGIGLFMLIPILVGLAYNEINPIFDFIVGFSICISIGLALTILFKTEKDLNWMHGMVIVSLSWVVATLLGAIPFYMSGHWNSFLDACFDAISGFATTGLVLVQDLDHLSFSHNMWRHLIMFLGGQGIVVIVLTALVRGVSGAFKIYVGEAREERVLPNVINTARFIWFVSVVYLVIGTFVLGIVAFFEGIPITKSFFHGLCIFMAAFDTGGFTPHQQNIIYYHSFAFELITIAIMVLGMMNFKLHHAIWTGNRKEIFRNIEVVSLVATIMIAFYFVAFDLTKYGVYNDAVSLFRKGFYQVISAHTGTGYATIYAKQFIKEWGGLGLFGMIFAMSLGGATCSTTGGIKALRIGITFKAFIQDIKRRILPESTVIVGKFHHIKDLILSEKQIRSALLIIVAYIALYLIGTVAGLMLGYPFLDSLFESTSAAANVGLSCGITNVSMPTILKVIYMLQMWAGRLEFISIFVLIGFFIAAIKGK